MKDSLPMFDYDQKFKPQNEEEDLNFIISSNEIVYPCKNEMFKKNNFIRIKTLGENDMPFSGNRSMGKIEKPRHGSKFDRRQSFRSSGFSDVDQSENNVGVRSSETNNTRKERILTEMQIDEIKKQNEDKKKEKSIKLGKSFLFRQRLQNVVDSNIFVVFFMVLTFFIMFIEDIQVFLPRYVDETIDFLETFTLFLFILEIVLTSIAKEDYVNSFFFWLDIISTVSLIMDISFMFDPILQIGSK